MCHTIKKNENVSHILASFISSWLSPIKRTHILVSLAFNQSSLCSNENKGNENVCAFDWRQRGTECQGGFF